MKRVLVFVVYIVWRVLSTLYQVLERLGELAHDWVALPLWRLKSKLGFWVIDHDPAQAEKGFRP